MWKNWYIVLGSWDPMAASYLNGKNVWISFGIPRGELAQMKFEMASGCEWEWVAYMLQKWQNIYIGAVERHADITWVLSERSSSAKLLQDTWRKKKKNQMYLMSAWDHRGHLKILRDHEKKQKNNNNHNSTKQRRSIMNWGDHEPSRSCGPLTREGATDSTRPSLNRPRYHVCECGPIIYEWLDSVQRSQVHLLHPHAPPPPGKTAPPTGNRESGKKEKKIACARELGGWVVYAWVRAWLAVFEGWVRTRSRDGGKKTNEKEA